MVIQRYCNSSINKILNNFWRTIEMPLINGEINLILTLSANYVITNSIDAGTFAIRDTTLYVSM